MHQTIGHLQRGWKIIERWPRRGETKLGLVWLYRDDTSYRSRYGSLIYSGFNWRGGAERSFLYIWPIKGSCCTWSFNSTRHCVKFFSLRFKLKSGRLIFAVLKKSMSSLLSYFYYGHGRGFQWPHESKLENQSWVSGCNMTSCSYKVWWHCINISLSNSQFRTSKNFRQQANGGLFLRSTISNLIFQPIMHDRSCAM